MSKQAAATLLFAVALGVAGCSGGDAPIKDGNGAGDGSATSGAAGTQGGAKGRGMGAGAEYLAKRVVYFEYDSSVVDDQNRRIVEAHAAHLAANPKIKLTLEGHCDERGTREYNMALGERRAQSVERMMRVLGIGAERIRTVSYGEEKPVDPGTSEPALARNRRVEIIY